MYATPARPRSAETEAARLTFLARYDAGTAKTYSVALDRLFEWCDHYGIEPLEVSRAHLELFSHWMTDERGLKNSTVYGYLSVCSTFYRLAIADGRIDRDPTVMLRKPKVHYDDDRLDRLSSHDMEKLILHACQRSATRGALVMLMGVMALRVSEAVNVRIEDIAGYKQGHRILRLVGKGGKPAIMAIPPLAFRTLDKAAGDRTEGPLISTRTGQKATRHDGYRWVQTLARQCGFGPINPHLLRHTCLTAALDAGASYREVQDLGRWSSGRMIPRYDRNRHNLDRSATYRVAAHLSGIADALAA